MMIVYHLATVTLSLCLWTCTAAAQSQGILGVWLTEKKNARVEISNCAPPAQGLCGKIVWISEPNDKDGHPQTDKANEDASLRNRPLMGLSLFEGWREIGASKWKGSIYDAEDGKSYDIEITLNGDTLKLEGCIAFLCDSDTWTRYKG